MCSSNCTTTVLVLREVSQNETPLILENSPELRIHALGIYYVQPKEIEWERYNLDRETLVLHAKLADTDKRLAELDRVLADEFPQYAELANPQPAALSEVQQLLGPAEPCAFEYMIEGASGAHGCACEDDGALL